MCTYGTSHGITVYHIVQMRQDRQEGMLSGVHMVYTRDVPWDPSVPHDTEDGMGWVQMAWDGQV